MPVLCRKPTERSAPQGRSPEARRRDYGIGDRKHMPFDICLFSEKKRNQCGSVRKEGGRQIGYGTSQELADAVGQGKVKLDLRRVVIRAAGSHQAGFMIPRSGASMAGAEQFRMVVRREAFAGKRCNGSPDRHQQIDGKKQQGYGSTGFHRNRGKCRNFSPNTQFFLPLYYGTAR